MTEEHVPGTVAPSCLGEQEAEEDEAGNTFPVFLIQDPSVAHTQRGSLLVSQLEPSLRT